MRVFNKLVGVIKFRLMMLCLFFDFICDMFHLLKKSHFDLGDFAQAALKYKYDHIRHHEALKSASDKMLVKMYLDSKTTKIDLCLVLDVYYKRHGVPIYLDIAIDATEYALKRCHEPEVNDPAFQEAFFCEMYNNIRRIYLKKIPFSS